MSGDGVGWWCSADSSSDEVETLSLIPYLWRVVQQLMRKDQHSPHPLVRTAGGKLRRDVESVDAFAPNGQFRLDCLFSGSPKEMGRSSNRHVALPGRIQQPPASSSQRTLPGAEKGINPTNFQRNNSQFYLIPPIRFNFIPSVVLAITSGSTIFVDEGEL